MDSVTLKPTFISFDFNSLNPTTQPLCPVHISFYRLTCFKKLGSFPIYSCYKRPPGPSNTHNQTCNKYSFSLNPFLGFVQVLQQFKGLASSQTKRWVYRLQSCSSQSEREMSQYSGKYLQNGSFGLALLSVTSNAKVRISPFLSTLAANPTFISGFFAWFIAQSIKMVLNFLVERKWDLRILFASGGMPSSHSALCTALTTSVALCHGVADSLFPVCLGFSLIVMYDAIGVRRHAGMQAEVRTQFRLPKNLLFCVPPSSFAEKKMYFVDKFWYFDV
uniref:Uncharacterized protein MANES_01G246400 n=1 Tax=Rhizophora mucronata TaxID=61149 RepID=A0A2P2JCC7_RHIMU